ncbi:MAG: efflux RND transporter permease subunit [Bryobacteraceae bacterium]|nr:efflux RND transporter permease subunit [Bryobacteraceae bacterium]
MTSALARFVDAHGRALVLVFFAFAVAGIVLTTQIPVSIFPQTDFPRVVVRVDNGIAPVDVQMLTVTRPLEQAIRTVPGITTVKSITARGGTDIDVFFRWDVNVEDALNRVQGRISEITSTLPSEARFYINRVTFSVFPMIGFSITSTSHSLADLWELAYYDYAPRLYRLPGVAETHIVGGRMKEYHVVVDPEKLNGYNIPLTKVVDALKATNLVAPSGMLQENYHLYLTTVTGLLRSPEQIGDVVVDVVKGTPVQIRDIASVAVGEEPTYNIVTANGRNAVLVNVLQQPDGNSIEIADAVNNEITQIRKTLPKDAELSVFYDQSILVRDSINGVVESILIGLFLSVAVLMGFLKNWRTTLVAAIVIPVAVLCAVVFMRLFNMSFNLMTLGGIAACIGVVIDDAIVMVENISVHMAMGQSGREASSNAIGELTPALIGSTLTPIMVFVPLVFLGGITAVFFRALAMTLVTALIASLLLALLFTPVLASLFIRPPKKGTAAAATVEAAEEAGEGRFMRRLTGIYERALGWALHHEVAILSGAAGVLLITVGIYYQLGSGFLPEMDEGAFVLDYVMPSGTSLDETDRVLRHIEKMLHDTPEVESYSRRTGAQLGLAIAEPNTGDFLIKLRRDRKRTLEAVTDDLRDQIRKAHPALDIEFPHILEDLVSDLASAPQPIEVKIYNDDPRVYLDLAGKVEEWLKKVPGVVDVVNQNFVIGPAVNFRVDPRKAALAGFTTQQVADMGTAILEGQPSSDVIRDNRLIPIRVRYPAPYRGSVAKLNSLLVTSPTGVTLPLSSLANIEVEEGQTEIHRENLRPLSNVTARLSGRDLGSAIAEIQRRLPNEIVIPPGTEIEYGGSYQIQKESFLGLTQVLLGSIVLIFIILVFEFRSFSHPTAILVATILCSSGALAALWITGTTLNISSFMGAIMVVGIVQKNGILMLDAERSYTEQGFGLRDAIFHAGRRRLRPILMTALATIFGMLPLAFGAGSGAQLLQPLAIAVIGGVSVSMLLSLLVTPVLFYRLKLMGL